MEIKFYTFRVDPLKYIKNMRNFFIKMTCLLSFSAIMTVNADEEKNPRTSTVETTQDGVRLKVAYLESFATNGNVQIDFTILNESKSVYKLIHADGIIDVVLNLTGPDGKQIIGYHDIKGSTIGRGNYKRFFTKDILPEQQAIGDSVPVSLFWPLETVGEYRCVLTKRIYRVDSTNTQKISSLRPGDPVDIVSPEFRFRIETIDKSYKSPAASMISKKENIADSTRAEHQLSSSRVEADRFQKKSGEQILLLPTLDRLKWYFIVVFLLVLLAFLIYYMFRQKQR